ncbi:hypothetical protein [Solirubrobacter soli]|uniref:hypothetical protein n=1 Tax=Solirubrobacter soli TaxID=363832 RepID=UPI00041B45C7|nr:hypothetical protein [Solirubrobacter soli]
MVHRFPRAVLGAVLAAALLAAPAHASTSSRIDVKLRAADRALDRASAGEDVATSLATVRRNVASARKTALRKPTPESLGRVARFDGVVVSTTVALFDGQTGADVTATATTLKASLDGRDAIVAAINALSDKSDYARVLAAINGDATGEADDIADALADDELTDEAKTALNAAATQAAATAATAPAASGDDADYPGDGDRADCADRGQRGDDDADSPASTPAGARPGRGFGGGRS